MRSLSSSVSALLHSRLLHSRLASALTEPRGVDHYLDLFAPTWSTREIRARVTGVRRETSDTVSLLLAPNANWQGFRAGQHLQLSVPIDGVRHTRTFSISSSPRAGTPLRLTIRAFPGGRVSGWALQRARRGDIVVLSPAQGEFVVPPEVPASLLFVTGGSGITPVMSMLRQLLDSGHTGRITCMHYARDEIIFHDELDALAREFSNFHFVSYITSDRTAGGPRPRFSRDELATLHPEWQHSETFVCGPAALESAVTEIWAKHDLGHRLHVERFRQMVTSPTVLDASASTARRLMFAKSGVVVQGNGAASLLVQAEGAGLRPAYGCRMGICHTCKCVKRSGAVHNAATGQISHAENETIQLCISTPVSDVTLDL